MCTPCWREMFAKSHPDYMFVEAQLPEDVSKKKHNNEMCAKEGVNGTLPEDVRKTLRLKIGTLINRFNRESDYAPIVDFFLSRQAAAKAEGYQDGVKAIRQAVVELDKVYHDEVGVFCNTRFTRKVKKILTELDADQLLNPQGEENV